MDKFTANPTVIADIFNNFVAANINPVLFDDPSYSFQRKMIFLMTNTIDFTWSDVPLSEVKYRTALKTWKTKKQLTWRLFYSFAKKKSI
jgi:hypothetical protein